METTSKPLKTMICIIGPTASGKSQLAMRLCRKNLFFKPEIISMDSAQIYKNIDIATAKPSKKEQIEFKHHLIDICDPRETYSVNRFIKDTSITIEEIERRKGTPIIVGGSMMYFNRLVNGMHSVPEIPLNVRNQIINEGIKFGWPSLHKKLLLIDKELANRISPHDSYRIQRGIEVFYHTGKSLSEWIKVDKNINRSESNYNFKIIALTPKDRSILHRKIKLRFDSMINNGLIDEVLRLKKRQDLTPKLPSIRIVGVKQTWDYLENKGNKDEFICKAVTATRQLAKRQLTWMKSFKNLNTVDSNEIDLNQIISICKSSP